MAQEETRKKKTGMARCLELASQHKGLVFISGILAAAAAVCSFLPYLSIYFIMRELIGVFPDMANANMSVVLRYGWMALGGIAGNVILYFCALMCSHLAAFGTLYELKLAFANHITEIPLGYHLTIGSGRMRKIMDENIESIEKFIAHQFPDFVASLVAPLALVILLLAIDWRYLTGVANFIAVAIVGLFLRFTPGIVMGYFVVTTTTVSEFVAAMERLHLPQQITIPMSVMFRFFPTVAEEWSAIGDAMRMRGVRFGGGKAGSILEYRMVPMMICSVKIGEELSAAALTRGLGGPVKRTNICKIWFRAQDIVLLLICLGAFAAQVYVWAARG